MTEAMPELHCSRCFSMICRRSRLRRRRT